MSLRSRIIRNATYLFLSDFILRGVGAAVTVLMARCIGATGYGELSVAFAWSSIGGYLTNLGLSQTFIREGTREGADVATLTSTSLQLRLFFAFITTVAMLPTLYFVYGGSPLRPILYIVVIPSIWGVALSGFGISYFQMTKEMRYVSFINGLSNVSGSALLVIAMLAHWSLLLIAITYGIAAIVTGLFALRLVIKDVGSLSGRTNLLLKGLGSFTIAGIVIITLPQLGPLVLERVSSTQEAGYFAAAYRLPLLLYGMPATLCSAAFPELFQFGNAGSRRHLDLSISQLHVMSLIAIVLALPLAMYPYGFMTALLGKSWSSTGKVLGLLAWMTLFHSINYPLADALTTQGLQSRRTAVLSCSAALAAVLYWLLGSRYGSIGAAQAMLSVEVMMLIGFLLANPNRISLIHSGIVRVARSLLLALAAAFLVRSAITRACFGIPAVFISCAITVFVFDKALWNALGMSVPWRKNREA